MTHPNCQVQPRPERGSCKPQQRGAPQFYQCPSITYGSDGSQRWYYDTVVLTETIQRPDGIVYHYTDCNGGGAFYTFEPLNEVQP